MAIAVYAGTFDPLTAGHLSVVQQAARLFTHVVVLVAVNPKKQTLFSAAERVEMIREATAHYPQVSAASTEGLVVEYARSICATVLVRGVRGAMDAQFETELAQTNRGLAPEIATIFLPAHAGLADVSSSALKKLAREGKDLSVFCPPSIAARLRERLAERGERA